MGFFLHRFRVWAVIGAVALVLTQASLVAAQPADTVAAAEALFREGRRLMDAGDYHAACEKFAASYELDVALGTLLNLANCYQLDGQLASAWARFVEAEAMARRAGDAPRGSVARERAAALEPRLVRVRVRVQSPVRGMRVQIGSREFAPALWGTAIPIDPGENTLTASAPRHETYTSTFRVDVEGATVEVDVPELEASPIEDDPAPTGPGTGPIATGPTTQSSSGSGVRATGWALSGVGLASLGVGFGFGANARSLWDPASCPDTGSGRRCVTPEAQAQAEDARTRANVSTGLVIGGATLLVTGIVLVVVGRDRDDDEDARQSSRILIVPTASAEGAGLLVGGRF